MLLFPHSNCRMCRSVFPCHGLRWEVQLLSKAPVSFSPIHCLSHSFKYSCLAIVSSDPPLYDTCAPLHLDTMHWNVFLEVGRSVSYEFHGWLDITKIESSDGDGLLGGFLREVSDFKTCVLCPLKWVDSPVEGCHWLGTCHQNCSISSNTAFGY